MTPDVETLSDHVLQQHRREVLEGVPEGRDAALVELRFADSLRLSRRSA